MNNFNFEKPPLPKQNAFWKQLSLFIFAAFIIALTANAALAYHGDGIFDENDLFNAEFIGRPIIIQQIQPSFGGCFISTGHGLLDDLDCDKVPDYIDNCPQSPNPTQTDQTGNGLGDACDLVINIVEPEPPVVMQGRSFITNVDVTNYREYEMRNLRLKVEVATLGIAETYYLDTLVPGMSGYEEAILRIPDCAYPGEHRVDVTVEYPYAAGHKEVLIASAMIAVDVSGACPMEPTSKDKTIVEILEIQDIQPDGGVYPFIITNNERFDKAYVMSIEGTNPWGYSQIEPGTLIVVPAGETREGAITIWANEGYTGEHSFVLTIQARDDIKQMPLLADIPEELTTSTLTQMQKVFAGIVVVALLLLIVGLLIVKKVKK